jgi:protein TonB
VLHTLALALFLSAAQTASPPSSQIEHQPTSTPSDADAALASLESQLRKIGGAVSAPRVIHKVEPKYPREARELHFQGIFTVQLIVDTQGRPRNVQVVQAISNRPGAGMVDFKDQEALRAIYQSVVDAISQYRFVPAMESGKPVPTRVRVQIDFRML